MQTKKKNLKEPIKLLVNLGKGYSGESFKLTFTSGKVASIKYVCQYDAKSGAYENCEKVTDDSVLCLLQNHRLPSGVLNVEKTVYVEDWQMATGIQPITQFGEVEIVISGNKWGVELVTGATDDFNIGNVSFTMLPYITRGKDGKTSWSDLTDDEKRELASILPTSGKQEAATVSKLGSIKVGEGLMITTEGTLSIDWRYIKRRLGVTEEPNSLLTTTLN